MALPQTLISTPSLTISLTATRRIRIEREIMQMEAGHATYWGSVMVYEGDDVSLRDGLKLITNRTDDDPEIAGHHA